MNEVIFQNKPTHHFSKNPYCGIGVIFFLFGQMIPYWLGDRHDPAAQIAFGLIAFCVGVCVGACLNWRDRRRARTQRQNYR